MTRILYHINQCALYKIGSKARLASVLQTSVAAMLAMDRVPQYHVFLLKEQTCPFTGKKTNERWVQEPVGGLRRLHERIRDLLMRITPPAYAHAAVKGRSYRTNAEAHASSAMVATFDITKFYPSTSETLVYKFFFEQMQCSADIAALLARLICFKARDATVRAGLSTGSPLSPVLSIYANRAMFDALEKLGETSKLRFTCYVDDLAFSGDSIPLGFPRMVKSTVERFSHRMADQKTHVFKKNQAKHVTGVILNNGAMSVPFGRFKKARRIERAIASTVDLVEKFELSQRLAGLLGEAAYLDKKYSGLAKISYRGLAVAKSRALAAGMSLPSTSAKISKVRRFRRALQKLPNGNRRSPTLRTKSDITASDSRAANLYGRDEDNPRHIVPAVSYLRLVRPARDDE